MFLLDPRYTNLNVTIGLHHSQQNMRPIAEKHVVKTLRFISEHITDLCKVLGEILINQTCCRAT